MLEGCDDDVDEYAANQQSVDDLGVVEDGFEDAQADVSGFATDQFNMVKQQKNVRDMFVVSQSRKFEAAGGTN